MEKRGAFQISGKSFIKKLVNSLGYEIHKRNNQKMEFYEGDLNIINFVKPYTLTSNERIFALIESVRYVIKNNIPGDFVECGVWKGGSVMTMAKVLLEQEQERDIHLFDTFVGMTKPTDEDKNIIGDKAEDIFEKMRINDNSSEWCNISLNDVKKNIFSSGYNNEKFHFIVGKVEETIPSLAPEKISLLRLDTDWYESTKHELIHLFPRLSKGGIIIIDDYWSWSGSRKATEEYFSQNNITIFLKTIDPFGGVIGVKM